MKPQTGLSAMSLLSCVSFQETRPYRLLEHSAGSFSSKPVRLILRRINKGLSTDASSLARYHDKTAWLTAWHREIEPIRTHVSGVLE